MNAPPLSLPHNPEIRHYRVWSADPDKKTQEPEIFSGNPMDLPTRLEGRGQGPWVVQPVVREGLDWRPVWKEYLTGY